MKTVYFIRVTVFALLALGLFLVPAPSVDAKQNPRLVRDINPTGGSGPSDLINVNGMLFFTADDGVHGVELWKSDGTKKGTRMVKDINPSGSTDFWDLLSVNGTLFFRAHDGSHGFELWKSDGTADGTVMLRDISSDNRYMIYEDVLANIGGTVFFVADDGVHGRELWKSDGTAADTVMVQDINPSGSSWPGHLADVNGTLYFDAHDESHANGLWKTDGTQAGTVLVKSIEIGGFLFTPANGVLFFDGVDESHGRELWKSGGIGRDEFTVLVNDFAPGPAWSMVYKGAAVERVLYFSRCTDSGRHCALWKTDGTTQGTVLLKTGIGQGNRCAHRFVGMNDTLFFTGWDNPHGCELWKSDGTPEGTVMVQDINHAGSSLDYDDFYTSAVRRGKLYFAADDGKHGYELWQSDGTKSGTKMVADLNPSDGSYPEYITAVGDRIFFTAWDGVHGNELWVYTP